MPAGAGLPGHPADRFHQFVHLVPLFDRIAGRKGTGYAVRYMIVQDLFLHLVESCTNGIDLGEDVDAVALALNHAEHPPDLAFDALQSRRHRGFRRVMHLDTIPWWGIYAPATSDAQHQSRE